MVALLAHPSPPLRRVPESPLLIGLNYELYLTRCPGLVLVGNSVKQIFVQNYLT